jgi:hypothetical protein
VFTSITISNFQAALFSKIEADKKSNQINVLPKQNGKTGGRFVVADQKIAGRNKAPLHLHSKQSRKLARSCFS